MMDDVQFRALYDAHVNDVFRFATSLCKSPEDVEEVVQNTFLRLATRYNDIRHHDRIRVWLLRVCRNETVSLWRRKKRHENAQLERPLSMDTFSSDTLDPADVAIDHEKTHLVRTAIASLSEPTRTVVLCRIYMGLSNVETASVLGWTTTRVRVSYSRGIKRLRNRLMSDADATRSLYDGRISDFRQ